MTTVAARIVRTTGTDPAFVELTRRLDAELWERYGDIQAAYAPHNVIVVDHVVLAYLAGEAEPIGCGCFKAFEAAEPTVELKRMYVARERRGSRVGRAIVDALCEWARELGHAAIVLETGDRQPEAVRLYEGCGFSRIPNFGPYVHLANSLCFRKPLLWT
jgi:GNAT superfamily N-acetyltransferase